MTNLLLDTIGESFIKHPTDLENFGDYLEDKNVLRRLGEIKEGNKERLAQEIYKSKGIVIDTNSILMFKSKGFMLINVKH